MLPPTPEQAASAACAATRNVLSAVAWPCAAVCLERHLASASDLHRSRGCLSKVLEAEMRLSAQTVQCLQGLLRAIESV